MREGNESWWSSLGDRHGREQVVEQEEAVDSLVRQPGSHFWGYLQPQTGQAGKKLFLAPQPTPTLWAVLLPAQLSVRGACRSLASP